jgi:hypothetical protein
MSAARLGEHSDAPEFQFLNRRPSAANLSTLGVGAMPPNAPMSAWPRLSAKKTTKLIGVINNSVEIHARNEQLADD